jgi:glyoxylase I family protein
MGTEMLGYHHVAIAVSNFAVSKPWYEKLFKHLGLAPAINATGYPHREAEGRLCIFAGAGGMFSVWEAEKASQTNKFHVYNVGLHHIAFAAPSKQAVDEFHEKIKKDGVKILDAPKEYQYVPGFYAVYFSDPDGMKLEYAYTPR